MPTKTTILPTVPNGVPLQRRITVLARYDEGTTEEGILYTNAPADTGLLWVECELQETPEGFKLVSRKNPDGITLRAVGMFFWP